MYKIEYTDKAVKSLKKFDKKLAQRIMAKIEAVAVDPYAKNNNVLPMTGESTIRLRVGGYRAILDINDKTITVIVVKVEKRGSVYK